MQLRIPDVTALFLLGAVAALIGDHSHVVTGTTSYFTDAVPYIWSSPIWFPVMVGSATVSLAELRVHLPSPRVNVTGRQCVAGVVAVVGTYVVTALAHTGPVVPVTALIVVLATITWCALGDAPSIVCGAAAAVIGPIVEIVLVKVGVFAYNADSSHLFGVALFLVPLYFAFGVVAAMLGEFAVARHAPVG